jgi:DivIVA domain-containing protein
MDNPNEPAGQTARIVTPEDIQRQEFGVSRFGGYRMRDVDEFLDRLTTSTQALVAENERLRAGGGPIVGAADLDDVNRQADEIIQRAREEAARIVAEASAGAPATPADRAAVDAFLSQERDFLQELAVLVQGHAETVKAMARRSRQPAVTVAADDAAAGADDADGEPAAATAETEPQGSATEDVVDVTDADQPTRVDMPPASGPTDRAEDDAPATPRTPPARAADGGAEGDPSLRALFWGDDG